VAVDWRWIGDDEVEGVGGRVVVVVKWGWNKWRWQSSGGGGGHEGSGEGNLSAVAVATGVELRLIGGGLVGGLAVDWWWRGHRCRR
jgi:hypothetical protein